MGTQSSPTGGVPVFSIGGRMVRQRERLLGMTDEERRWRAQYLKDLILEPGEPRFSPEYYRTTTNIFRRTVRFPMQILENALTPVVGKDRAHKIRFFIGRSSVMFLIACGLTYYFSYNTQDWTSHKGWTITFLNRKRLPGDPGYPHVVIPEKHEYFDLGFSKSHFYKK